MLRLRSNCVCFSSYRSIAGLLLAVALPACGETNSDQDAPLVLAPNADDTLESAQAQEPAAASTPAAQDRSSIAVNAAAAEGTPDAASVVLASDEVASAPDAGTATADAAPSTSPDASAPASDDAAAPCTTTWYEDCDGDGYAAAAAQSVVACEQPDAQNGCRWTQRAPAAGAVDCEDSSQAHHPGASFGFPIPGTGGGLPALLCRPDGSYTPKSGVRCVETTNPDLNCDGRLEPEPTLGALFFKSGHPIGELTHACSSSSDCDCWKSDTPPCGAVYGVSALLCSGAGFLGDTALACR